MDFFMKKTETKPVSSGKKGDATDRGSALLSLSLSRDCVFFTRRLLVGRRQNDLHWRVLARVALVDELSPGRGGRAVVQPESSIWSKDVCISVTSQKSCLSERKECIPTPHETRRRR